MTPNIEFRSENLRNFRTTARDPWIFDNKERLEEQASFGFNGFAIHALTRNHFSGELYSAQLSIRDFESDVNLELGTVDTNLAFNSRFRHPHLPYRAMIALGEAYLSDGVLHYGADWGKFFYDRNGILRAVVAEQISKITFASGTPTANFVREEKGDSWLIFPRSEGTFIGAYSPLADADLEPIDKKLLNGQEVEIAELVYSITDEERGATRFEQKTATGHRSKVVTVPTSIDLMRWYTLLSAPSEDCFEILKEFPIAITLQT